MTVPGRDPDRDYYNDLPGKVPPDVGPPPVPPLPSIVHSFSTLPNVYTPNLIDLTSESVCDRDRTHDYVNDGVVSGAARDVFDMRKYSRLPSPRHMPDCMNPQSPSRTRTSSVASCRKKCGSMAQ